MNIEQFDFSVDIEQALIWQYDSAPVMQSLFMQKQVWYDVNQTAFWENWYANVFNLLTANVFGLSVWSIILNIPLYVSLVYVDNAAPIIGFTTGTYPSYTNSYLNFNGVGYDPIVEPPFIGANYSPRGTTIILTEEEQRVVLRLRYFQMTTRGDITDINAFLNWLYLTSAPGSWGNAWVLDGLNMTMRYIFDFWVPSPLLTVLQQLDLLPRPATVGISYYIHSGGIFGFGVYNQNFTNGAFIPDYFVTHEEI